MIELKSEIKELISTYREVSSIRNVELFSKFLFDGYKMTTLNCVDSVHFNNVIFAKMHLGMLITLYDDLADNPKFQDNELLKILYMLPFAKEDFKNDLSIDQLRIYNLSKILISGLEKSIKTLPNYKRLNEFFLFDLEQVFSANKYSSLIANMPQGASSYESIRYGSFNMGIVAAGMIDLMGSSTIVLSELGTSRSAFHHAQRMGRISNLLATLDRELEEDDVTNELFIQMYLSYDSCRFDRKSSEEKVMKEFNSLSINLVKHKSAITFFSVEEYNEGIKSLHDFHLQLKGTI
jgi:hypothetical protein